MISYPNGKLNIGYFTNWSGYARKYTPHDVPAESLTHILYSFANLQEDGQVVLTDKWADEDLHFEGDSWQDVGTNVYGNLKQLYLLKKRHRHLKVLLSIGGWTYSPRFAGPMSQPAGRACFVESCIRLLEDYGFDGIDVDWEYPNDEQQAWQYVELLRDLRMALDKAQNERQFQTPGGVAFDLSIAAPCGRSNYEKLKLREMDQYLSFWNLMAYDYSGSWDDRARHQAALFATPGSGALDTDSALRYFTSQGIAIQKLVLGIPLYGRSFANCAGVGHPFSGVGQGSWEQGVYDYKALPLAGSAEHVDSGAVAASCYVASNREWVSYDNVETALRKAQFIGQNGLAGAMYWELSGDRQDEQSSIVKNVAKSMGGPLDSRSNCLDYPGSKFDNMRRHMQ